MSLKGKGTPATVKLFVDGKEVGRGDLPVTIPIRLGLGAALTVGADPGSPTMPDYQPRSRSPARSSGPSWM